MTHALQIRRLRDDFVGEVIDLPSPRLREGTVVTALQAALHEHQVLILRDQRLRPEALVAFGRLWGDLRTETPHASLPELPELAPISNSPAWGHLGVGTRWHSDGMFLPRRSRISMLYAHQPAESGGETLFCNAYRAYDTLDEETRSAIVGREAVHMTRLSAPMALTHPETQRKALYINLESTISIRGLPLVRAMSVLARLEEHLSREDLVYRHRYRPGDLVILDGFSTMHRVTPGPTDGLRILYRVTTLGDGPPAA